MILQLLLLLHYNSLLLELYYFNYLQQIQIHYIAFMHRQYHLTIDNKRRGLLSMTQLSAARGLASLLDCRLFFFAGHLMPRKKKRSSNTRLHLTHPVPHQPPLSSGRDRPASLHNYVKLSDIYIYLYGNYYNGYNHIESQSKCVGTKEVIISCGLKNGSGRPVTSVFINIKATEHKYSNITGRVCMVTLFICVHYRIGI